MTTSLNARVALKAANLVRALDGCISIAETLTDEEQEAVPQLKRFYSMIFAVEPLHPETLAVEMEKIVKELER